MPSPVSVLALIMSDTAQLYASILGLTDQGIVAEANLVLEAVEVAVFVAAAAGKKFGRPERGTLSSQHDHRTQRWRHLDTNQYKTTVEAEVPRASCAEHGVRKLAVSWGEPDFRLTSLFEAVAIERLRETGTAEVVRWIRLSRSQVNRIIRRVAKRELLRRELEVSRRIGVDETPLQNKHGYATVAMDLESSDVLYVADIRPRLEPTKRVAHMVRDQLQGILNAIALKATHAAAASADSRIPQVKRMACGFSNRQRFKTAMYFHLGGPNL